MLSLVLIGYFGYRAHILHCAFQPSVNARVLLRHASSMCLSTSFARAPSIAQELAFAHDSNVHKLLCTYSALAPMIKDMVLYHSKKGLTFRILTVSLTAPRLIRTVPLLKTFKIRYGPVHSC